MTSWCWVSALPAMTAAVTAADAGAKVLIAEKMSEALAGGNSKVARSAVCLRP